MVRIPPRPGVLLAQLSANESAYVHSVAERVPEILSYLGGIGLRPGVRVEIVEKAPLGGPVTVRIDGAVHAISLELARMVTVTPHLSAQAPA